MFLENYFDNEKDRDDFLIALGVIVFFIWLLWQIGFSAFDKFKGTLGEAGIISMADADGDGIADNLDECPNLKGIALYSGCPTAKAYDRDGDEIANSKDKCPDVKGSVLNDGCPTDVDGDGFTDANDDCPNVYGKFNGCPDADMDKDGIPNQKDKCPREAGTAENNGCPVTNNNIASGAATAGTAATTAVAVVDTDGDGVADDKDKCPKVKGDDANGCPKVKDADGDGVVDERDRCPSEKGPANTSGCPDKDGDGVADKLDKCPTVKGVRATAGCPDKDGDGIADNIDKCPTEKGVRPDGCPKKAEKEDPNKDTDGDGVADRFDNCPNTKGVATNKGCPEVKLSESEQQALLDAIKNVQFENAKAELTAASKGKLNKVAEIMNKYKTYKLSIEGHTSADGKDITNQRLSDSRAKACYTYLTTKGVNASRMKYKGYGETRLKDKANPNSGTNRRVEFDLYE